MKKFKFLPSILMLALSVAVLALGVYAATPSTNTVTGSIKVNASAYPIAIRCLLDGEEIENHPTIRAGIEWTKGLSGLSFNTDTALSKEDVEPIVLTLQVTNLSNINLAAYWGNTPKTSAATLSDISVQQFLTKDGQKVVQADKTGYKKLEPNQMVEMNVTMSLYEIFYTDMGTLNFDYYLNVEECQDKFVSGIFITGAEQASLTEMPSCDLGVQITVRHVTDVETSALSEVASGSIYSTANLKVDDDNYENQYLNTIKRYRTTVIEFAFKNTTAGMDYDITTIAYLDNPNIELTTTKTYLPWQATSAKASVQFTVKRDKNGLVGDDLSIDGVQIYVYFDNVGGTVGSYDARQRVLYDEEGLNGGDLHYYVEYGVNPQNPNKKLRWYMFGKQVYNDSAIEADRGWGQVVALDASEKQANAHFSGSINGVKYCFVAENSLDSYVNLGGEKPFGIQFCNEGDDSAYGDNGDGEDRSIYEGSLLQRFLSGESVRTEECVIDREWEDDSFYSAGCIANFYNIFKLDDDELFTCINERTLGDLSGQVAEYSSMADKFWSLSVDEFLILASENAGGYDYWLRDGRDGQYTNRIAYGDSTSLSNNLTQQGFRPAFMLSFE